MIRIQTDFGFVVSLGQTEEVSTSILEILPKKKISKHFHKKPVMLTSSHKGSRLTLDAGWLIIEQEWYPTGS